MGLWFLLHFAKDSRFLVHLPSMHCPSFLPGKLSHAYCHLQIPRLPSPSAHPGLYNNTLSSASLFHLASLHPQRSLQGGGPPFTHRSLNHAVYTLPHHLQGWREQWPAGNYIWLWETDLPSQIWLFKDNSEMTLQSPNVYHLWGSMW